MDGYSQLGVQKCRIHHCLKVRKMRLETNVLATRDNASKQDNHGLPLDQYHQAASSMTKHRILKRDKSKQEPRMKNQEKETVFPKATTYSIELLRTPNVAKKPIVVAQRVG